MEILLTALANAGPVGLVGGVCFFIIIRLHRENGQLQDKRIEELKAALIALTANTTALQTMTSQTNATSQLVQSMSQVLLTRGQGNA
jgi:hypothetical protein